MFLVIVGTLRSFNKMEITEKRNALCYEEERRYLKVEK